MENSRFIEIHAKNQQSKIQDYIATYESGLTNESYQWLTKIIFSAPYLSTIIKLIQANQKGIEDNKAWSFFMDWDCHSIYKALKSINY